MRHLNKILETNWGKIKEQDVPLTYDYRYASYLPGPIIAMQSKMFYITHIGRNVFVGGVNQSLVQIY